MPKLDFTYEGKNFSDVFGEGEVKWDHILTYTHKYMYIQKY